MIPIAVAFAVGTAAGLCTNFEQRILAALVLASLCAWSYTERRASVRLRAVIVLALACGFGRGHLHTLPSQNINETRTNRYEATVLSCVEAASSSMQCGLALTGSTVVLAHFAHAHPSVGRRIVVRGRITPFDGPRNPGEPDERSIQSERGYTASLQGANVLRDLGPARADVRFLIARMQSAAGTRLRLFLEEPYASIVAGELWGERAALPVDLRAEFQDSGTVHVLVTAGLHLGVIALLVITALTWLRTPRLSACAIAALLIWLYVLFSGAHLPAIRAGTMITFALAARACGAKALSWNALAAAVIVVLMLSPSSIMSASFAMSFSCVGSIVLLSPYIERSLQRFDIPPQIIEPLTLTLATQGGVWPLTGSTFLLFSPYAVLANAVVVPVVGATMILGGLQIEFAPLAKLAYAFANINSWLLTWMVSVIRLTAELPHAHVIMTPPPLWAIALYDAGLFLCVWLVQKRAFTAAAAVLSFAVFNIVAPPQQYARDLQVTVLDVGQADAIVIRTPAGHVFLVDAGGRLERGPHTAADSAAEHVGESIVVPFLIRSGIHRIDALLLSHPHGDHVGGAPPVLRTLGADEFADTAQQYGGFAYQDALSVLHSQGTPVVYPRAGTVWHTNDGVTLTFLGPEMPFITGSRNDINNNSLVFMLQYRSFRMLFTGDAGAEAEQRILSEGTDLHATVLKVGHHGSAYSSTSEFIAAVHPKYAIISVGRHNLFGHPAPSTIDTLQHIGATIYRTDEDDAIMVTTDGVAARVNGILRS
ncbi:MAG: DNA internalization-related competence protein ComEC/Rec2 [Candidatus Baltobacteraceae bacterium]